MFRSVISLFNRQLLERAATPAGSAADVRHSMLEDIYAFAIGCSLVVLGFMMLHSHGLVTGGVAGMALLLSYLIPMEVGTLFMCINLPFFIFAYLGMGLIFTVKTIIASLGIMTISTWMPSLLHVEAVHPFYGAIFGGTLMGLGILSLARHGAGAGGTGVLSLYLQRKRGINAGKTQLAMDSFVILCAFLQLDLTCTSYSILSAAAMSAVMVSYHKPARYLGH